MKDVETDSTVNVHSDYFPLIIRAQFILKAIAQQTERTPKWNPCGEQQRKAYNKEVRIQIREYTKMSVTPEPMYKTKYVCTTQKPHTDTSPTGIEEMQYANQ